MSKESSKDWPRVKFGDVVRLSKVRCANPLAEGVERIVGLEHLESGAVRAMWRTVRPLSNCHHSYSTRI
ncbi:hypothetical protein KEF85_08045 [Methylomonas paludis]|uniref:Uncharacterized protein n=1 Tax=Methylomonas paludis TaxID=1173101 RepID=A0A975MRW5_9GAMM|nr:hypothetical protein [Methylomonas paludis]QWF72384.1 hypothetical protein KEF85_08045 [Methylomonas paludis]